MYCAGASTSGQGAQARDDNRKKSRMNLPADITQWDYDTICGLATQRDYEPGIYDFKEVLSGTGTDESRKKLNDSICRTICAIANTDDGYLIFGVKDPKKYPNLTEQ